MSVHAHGVHNAHAAEDAAESGIVAVQVRSVIVHDEELAGSTVRVIGTGHGQDTALMLDRVVHAVGGEFALDVCSAVAGAVTEGTSALGHESGDDSVEGQTVVEAFVHKAKEVFNGNGSGLRIEFQVDISVIRDAQNDHGIVCSWRTRQLPRKWTV